MKAQERRVLFVAFDVDRDKYTYMSVAFGSLQAALLAKSQMAMKYFSPPSEEVTPDRAHKHAEMILTAARESTPEDQDILFGVYVWNDALTRKVHSILRQEGVTNRIILGGPQITWARPGTLERLYPHADVFIRGEGEQALVEVTRTTDHVDVPGVHYAGEEDGGTRAQADLATLPSPFLDEPLSFIPIENVQRARWETKRGCRFGCWFCQHSGASRKLRCFSMERLTKEIKCFVEKDVRLLTVVDPLFNAGETYMDVLGQLKRLGYRGKQSLQCHFDLVNDEFLKMARQFDVCLEFGLQTVNPDECSAIGRRNDLGKVQDTMRKLGDLGIHYEIDLIYGLPAQTVDSLRRSVDFCQKRNVPVVRCWPFMLLRGTVLDSDEQRREWRFQEGFRESIPSPVVVSSSSYDEEDWEEMRALSQELHGQYDPVHREWAEESASES